MQKLIAWKNSKKRKPLIIKGVRQCGKTYLLKQFGKDHFRKCHYFNFEKEPSLAKIFKEDLTPHKILESLSFHIGSDIQVSEDLVFFDEIQECPRALTSLKYFQEDCPNLYLCGAGSLLGLHLDTESFPVGKVTFETLRPMCFEEFLIASNDKALPYFQNFSINKTISQTVHEHLWDKLKHYLIVGGLPEVVQAYSNNQDQLFQSFSLIRKKQEDLLNTYYADIAKHSGKVNAMHIDRVLRAVPSQLAQNYDGSVQRFKFKDIVPGVSHYSRLARAIDWLEAAGLVLRVPILNTARGPLKGYYRENFFKLLLFDIGMLGAMTNLSPKSILEYEYGSYKGYFAENFIAQELICALSNELFSWQESKNELEFLVELEGNIIPLEVKAGRSIQSNSLKAFSKKYSPIYQVLFSANPAEFSKKMHRYPLYLAGRFPVT